MDSKTAQYLYRKYAAAMACVEVRRPDGSLRNGSAFHVGEGVFVTAGHVLDGNELVGVHVPTWIRVPLAAVLLLSQEQQDAYVEWLGAVPQAPHFVGELPVRGAPSFHPEANVDVACFRVDLGRRSLPVVPLGTHIEDWTDDRRFVLSSAVLLGFPPIPMTADAHLVAARAEVNAVIHTRHGRHRSFVLSALARGGLSGGVAISEWDFALGVITESLGHAGQPVEVGFLTVIGVEPIYECLAANKMLPLVQRQEWGDFWNTDRRDFTIAEGRAAAAVTVCDDGSTLYVEVHVMIEDGAWLFQKLASIARAELPSFVISDRAYKNPTQPAPTWKRWTAPGCDDAMRSTVASCAEHLSNCCVANGLSAAGIRKTSTSGS